MHKPLKFSVWFSVIIAAVFVVAWLWIRESSVSGPYDLEPVSIVRNGNKVSPVLSETAGWQIYRNEKHGFEFKYPKDWKRPTITTNNILFGCQKVDGIDTTCILVISFKEKKDASAKVADYTNCPLIHDALFVREKYVINFRGCKEIYQNNNTYDQILSTFRFLE